MNLIKGLLGTLLAIAIVMGAVVVVLMISAVLIIVTLIMGPIVLTDKLTGSHFKEYLESKCNG